MCKVKVSILTIVRNPEVLWFHECLSSVANQLHSNIEHVIVDGSDEAYSSEVFEIVSQYPNSVYNRQLSNGLWPAFEEGLALCTGDVIGVINSDDYLADPHVLEEICTYFPDYDYIYGNSERVDVNGDRLYVQKPLKWLNSYLFDHLVFNISHHTLYFKRDILKDIPFLDDSYGVEAYDLIFCRKLFRSSLAGQNIKRTIACFRLHESNHSRSYSSSDTQLLYRAFTGSKHGYFLWRCFQYMVNPKYFYYLLRRTISEMFK